MLNYDVEPQSFASVRPTRHGAGLVQGTNVHQPCGLSILPHKATRVFPRSVFYAVFRWKDTDPVIPILKQAKAEYEKLQ